jgi:hypothetical protein
MCGVPIDGVWILTLIYCALTQFIATDNDYSVADSRTLQFAETSQPAVSPQQFSGNVFQRRAFPFHWVPELSPASVTGTLDEVIQDTELLYDKRIVANHFVLAPSPLKLENKQTNCVAFSPQSSHTDLSTATSRRILMPTFVDRGVSRGPLDGSPTVVNLSFLDRSRYFSFK